MDIDPIARANRAKQLLDDELFNEAFEMIAMDCLAQWKETPVRDTEARERLWMMIKLNDRLKLHYESIINDGKIASKEAEIAEIERKSKLRNIFK